MYQKIYERIAGVSFDAHGFARQGDTLCVIVSHPTARGNPAEMRSGAWWSAKGREMQLLAAPAAQALVACMPMSAPAVTLPQSSRSDVRFVGIGNKAFPRRHGPKPTDVIRLLVHENPKLSTSRSRHRFDCYMDGMTVAEYETVVRRKLGDAEARKIIADLRWDCDRNFIRLERDGRPIELSISTSMNRT